MALEGVAAETSRPQGSIATSAVYGTIRQASVRNGNFIRLIAARHLGGWNSRVS